jgi:hypothetical protein
MILPIGITPMAITNDDIILGLVEDLSAAAKRRAVVKKMQGLIDRIFGQLKQRALTGNLLPEDVATRLFEVISDNSFSSLRPSAWRKILFFCFPKEIAKERFPEFDFSNDSFDEGKKRIKSFWNDAMSRRLPGSFGGKH